MELRHLRYFVAVAEALSFSRAATTLHVSQPSLSRQIKDLEEEMGVLLLDRSKNPISLTAAGRSFLADSRQLLATNLANVETAQRLSQGEPRQLNIGYIANLHYELLPATLGAFRRLHPKVALNLFDMTCAEQLRALAGGKIDLGFVGLRESLEGTGLRGECIRLYKVLVALPAHEPLAAKARIRLQDLETRFFLGLAESSCQASREWLLNLAPTAGFTPRILQDADREPAMLSFVAAGLGVALLPEPIRRIAHEGVVFRPLKPAIEAESFIAWKEDNHSKPLQRYIQIVRELSSETGT